MLTGTGIPERVISEAATVAFMGVACGLATPTEPPEVRDGDDLLPRTQRQVTSFVNKQTCFYKVNIIHSKLCTS